MSEKNRYFCNVSQQVLSEVVGISKTKSLNKVDETNIFYSAYSRLGLNTVKNHSQNTPWPSQNPRENTVDMSCQYKF